MKLILSFYGAMLDSCREKLVAIGGESCRFSQEPESDSCFNIISKRSVF